MTATKSPWLPVLPQAQSSDVRLLCIPHAGAGASIYRNWIGLLPQSAIVCPVQLPGREERYTEAPKNSIFPVASELARAIAATVAEPYILFGYSMGALIAFEVARYARRLRFPMPSGLVVVAHQAPHCPISRKRIWSLPESQFITELREMGGMPEEVFSYPELLEYVLPVLRADFEACDCYTYVDEPPLDIPIAAIGGSQDRHVSMADLQAWQRQTSQRCSVHVVPGGHFFLKESRDSMMATLRTCVDQLRAGMSISAVQGL